MITINIYEEFDKVPFNLDFSNIFYQNSWHNILQKSLDYKQLYICINKDNKLLYLSGSLIKIYIFNIFYSNIPYGGFIGDYEIIQESMEPLERELKRLHVDRIYLTRNIFHFFPDLHNYKIDYGYQTLLPLDKDGIENFKKAYKEKIKRNINKAQRQGVTITADKNGEKIDFFYKMYVETMKKKGGIKFWNDKFFKMICDEYLKNNRCVFLYAIFENNPIAALLLLKSSRIIHYFAGVSDERYLFLRPNDFLFFSAIENAIEEGYDFFDFMQTNRDDNNLLRFKEKWGAVTNKFYKFYKDLSLRSSIIDVLLKIRTLSFFKTVFS